MSVAGSIATELNGKAGKPAHLIFKTKAKHLPKRSEKEGRYIAKDVDMVEVRQIGASDCIIYEVETWLKQIQADLKGGRLPAQFAEFYNESYRRWKAGQEMPVEGTPIKGWQVITPAQQDMLIHAGIRTVEDMADLNDEGLKKVGMGAIDLKNKAKAWLAVGQDKGKLTQEMAAMQKENELLKGTVDKLTSDMDELKRLVKLQKNVQAEDSGEISANELLDDEPPTPKRGKR